MRGRESEGETKWEEKKDPWHRVAQRVRGVSQSFKRKKEDLATENTKKKLKMKNEKWKIVVLLRNDD